MISKEKKLAVSEPFKAHKTDTGSTSVQISLLTERINDLSRHLTTNKKDHASRLGLLKMVGQRRRLLNYLGKSDEKQYQKVISELNLRK
jgi:small subunit ribosomal protein S15